jgi:hypothetical protein
VGRRARKRQRAGGGGGAQAVAPSSTTSYTDPDGNVLTLRDELSAGTIAKLDKLETARPGDSAYDRWQRRVELMFEHLTTTWEVAGLPLEGQKELLGRYRMASQDERKWVRETIAAHLRERYPEIDV